MTARAILAAAVVAASTWGSGPALANEHDLSPADVAAVVNAVPGVSLTTTRSVTETTAGLLAEPTSSETVEVPSRPEDGIRLESETGPGITIALPGARRAEAGVTVGATTVYQGAAPATDLAVQPTVDGGARALMVIDGQDAPTRFSFRVGIDGGGTLQPTDDGGIDVIDAQGFAIGRIDPPWAVDAEGRRLPTRYDVRDTTIVQTVDHAGGAYPIVADPKFTRGTVTGTIYFNKLETRDIASAGAGAAVCTVIMRLGVPGAIIGSGCAVAAASIVVQANRAKNRNMCLKIKHTLYGPPVWWPDIYSGGHCR